MITEFKLMGLSKPKSATCEPLHSEDTFWPMVELTQDRFDALWNFCKGDWGNKKIAEIEHDGLDEDGLPINPALINIKLV